MLKKDKDVLLNLVNNYEIKDIIANLARVVENKAHDCSDLGLKERSIECAKYSSLLEEILQ